MSFIMAIDQGTTSTRAMLFDDAATMVSSAQLEHRQYFPRPGWVEHDPIEIRSNVDSVIVHALAQAGLRACDVAAVGVTNQRETVVLWDRRTGVPVHPAIVWQDTRTQPLIDELSATGGTDRFRTVTGLPLATYFSASKLAWLLDHVPGARARAEAGELAFGTTDSWVVWNLTGGPAGGRHLTDVTNASRTMLMDLTTLSWSDDLLETFGVPRTVLPEIRSSSELYGTAARGSVLPGVPVAGILGDQQSALFGQAAFSVGESKITHGTGSFLLVNTGERVPVSTNGLISTVAFQLGDMAPNYAVEGSIASTGALVQWLRDNLGILSSSAEVESLAAEVPDHGGVYIVPAFSGLFAPHWRPDARGVIVGLTRFATKAHLARAALEATAFQSREVLDAASADAGTRIGELRVDGGMVRNELLMQFQADVLGVPVVRPVVSETTALGAASVAGLAAGVWSGLGELRATWAADRRWEPSIGEAEREARLAGWRKAVDRALDWVD